MILIKGRGRSDWGVEYSSHGKRSLQSKEPRSRPAKARGEREDNASGETFCPFWELMTEPRKKTREKCQESQPSPLLAVLTDLISIMKARKKTNSDL